jgi:hypothetical protein
VDRGTEAGHGPGDRAAGMSLSAMAESFIKAFKQGYVLMNSIRNGAAFLMVRGLQQVSSSRRLENDVTLAVKKPI